MKIFSALCTADWTHAGIIWHRKIISLPHRRISQTRYVPAIRVLLLFLFSLSSVTQGTLTKQHGKQVPGCAVLVLTLHLNPELCFLQKCSQFLSKQLVPSQRRPPDTSFLNRWWVIKFESSLATKSRPNSLCAYSEDISQFPVFRQVVGWMAVTSTPPQKRLPRQIIVVARTNVFLWAFLNMQLSQGSMTCFSRMQSHSKSPCFMTQEQVSIKINIK